MQTGDERSGLSYCMQDLASKNYCCHALELDLSLFLAVSRRRLQEIDSHRPHVDWYASLLYCLLGNT